MYCMTVYLRGPGQKRSALSINDGNRRLHGLVFALLVKLQRGGNGYLSELDQRLFADCNVEKNCGFGNVTLT